MTAPPCFPVEIYYERRWQPYHNVMARWTAGRWELGEWDGEDFILTAIVEKKGTLIRVVQDGFIFLALMSLGHSGWHTIQKAIGKRVIE